MHNTLELGRAGTEEWVAASKNLTLPSDSHAGLTCYSGHPGQDFTTELFERDLKRLTHKLKPSEPVLTSK